MKIGITEIYLGSIYRKIGYCERYCCDELDYCITERPEDLIVGFNTSNKIGKVCSGYKTKIFRPPTL